MLIEEEKLVKASKKVEIIIKSQMIKLSLTQADLAAKIGVSRQAVNSAIQGSSTPKSRMVRKRIYQELGIDKGVNDE